MTFLKNDPITKLAFSVYENKGVFAVLLGSGLSRSAEIPTGWEITLDIIRRVAAAQGVQEHADWAQWYRDTTGLEPNYSVVLEEIANSPEERRAILHSYIEPTEIDQAEGRKVPTKAHRAIAKLVLAGYIKVIVTTNFDRLMENALREYGVEPTVVASADVLAGAEPLTHSRCYILKLHGDYKDARILNTDEELNAYPESYNLLLDRIFDEHGLIICGWSGEWDHALRAAFLRAPNRRYPVYWTARGYLGAGAQELSRHRAAMTVPITGADEFFQALQQRVETLEQTQRQSPMSVELLVSSAKRFLSKPESRIQLHDLFADETDRLLSQLDSDTLAVHGQWSAESFRSRVQIYESAAEPLARMAGVSGRWGDGAELEIILDILRSLYHHAGKVGNGLNSWLRLRSYPAVLVFTAYGIGLTKARRWEILLKLLMSVLAYEHGNQKLIVSTLFLNAWDGSANELWQQLEGFDRRKTPLSDHLLEVMTQWHTSFTGVEANFELLFERFELMGSLAAFHDNDEEKLEKAAESIATHRDVLAWMPVGRSGWNRSVSNILMQELDDNAKNAELLAVGFAKGSEKFLQLFIKNFTLYIERMRWS